MRGLPAAGVEPVGGGQRDGVFGQHAGQAGQHVGEVFLRMDAQATAVFDDGVEDGALLAGLFIADEQPVLGSQLGRADRVFDEIVADLYPTVTKVGLEVRPLVDGVADGFAAAAAGQGPGRSGRRRSIRSCFPPSSSRKAAAAALASPAAAAAAADDAR